MLSTPCYTVTVVALNIVGGGQYPPSKPLLLPKESGSYNSYSQLLHTARTFHIFML